MQNYSGKIKMCLDIYVNEIDGEKIHRLSGTWENLKKFYMLIKEEDAYENNGGFFEKTYAKEEWNDLVIKYNFFRKIVKYQENVHELFEDVNKHFENSDNDIKFTAC